MAYKTFANGYPLTASELNNYLMNQSVISFASSAARASAITSPVEGMLTYLEDTNSYEGWNGSAWTDINDNTGAIAKSLLTTAGDTIYATGASTPARLGIGGAGALLKSTGSAPAWLSLGTNGQILTSNGSDVTWATPSGGGGMVLLSTTTASGTSTTVSSISQSYKSLQIVISGLTIGTAGYVYFQLGPNGSPNDPTVVNNLQNTSGTLLQQSGYGTLTASSTYTLKANSSNNAWVIRVDDYASTTNAKPVSFSGAYQENNYTGYQGIFGHGIFQDYIGALASFRLASNQSFTAGTIKIYGVN